MDRFPSLGNLQSLIHLNGESCRLPQYLPGLGRGDRQIRADRFGKCLARQPVESVRRRDYDITVPGLALRRSGKGFLP